MTQIYNRYPSKDGTFEFKTTKQDPKMLDEIIANLRKVFDPEISINIFDLGLIYKLDIVEDNNIECKMTLTSPFCPVAGEMPIWVKEAIEAAKGVNTVKVEMTFDPTFTPEYASELAQMDLGFMSSPEPDYDNWNPR
jgi:FeS assembly SUF system protein|tara:strand:- start:372 stop:782 length:411 start_codon:yes stop_codon:yes gene_type:complete